MDTFVVRQHMYRNVIYWQEFRLVHYAGDVTYSVNGFLEKNSDLLFRDLKQVRISIGCTIIVDLIVSVINYIIQNSSVLD